MRPVAKNTLTDNLCVVQEADAQWLEKLFYRLNVSEIKSVHWAIKAAHIPHIKNGLVFINHLGNGWLYLFIAIILIMAQGQSSWRLLTATGLAALFAHCIYPLIKKRLARLRPCDFDPSLDLYVKVLDQYSCPSGHVMTATAVGIPMLIMLPGFSALILLVYLLIAWARISLGHHYPSDLLLGALLGAVISAPISIMIL